MAKLVWLVMLGAVAFLLIRALRRSAKRKPPVTSRADKLPDATAMVACAHCGVHLPEPEAIGWQGRHYCSDAHRLRGPQQP